jgi:hypothetical protein
MSYSQIPKRIRSVIVPTGADQHGSVLIIALLALVVLSVLGLAFMTISKTESDISYNDRDSGKALYIADAGLERFKRDLRYDVTYLVTGALNTSISDQYLASPAPSGDGTLGPDTTGQYVKSTAPVKRYYDMGAALYDFGSTEFPTASNWNSVSPVSVYLQTTLNGGNYTLKLAKNDKDAIFALSTGSVGSRVARTLEVKYEVKSLSVWDNAIFGGTGASGAIINGNCTIAGSVHILGTGLTATDTAMDLGGGATILNQYTGISSTLNNVLVLNALAIAALPGKLRTELRVKRGLTSINSGASGVGESTCKVKGVYTNDGFSGSQPGNVYSDNGKNQKYDLPADLDIPFPMPDTANPPLSTALDITASLPLSGGVYKLNADTPNFSLSSGANSISWNQAAGTLTLSGVFKVNGNLDLAKKNAFIYYNGKGTLWATGNVVIHDCVFPATASSFPTTNAIGVIAGNDIEICTGAGESAARLAGAFYAVNRIISAKQTQTAGTWVSNYFDLGSQVPSVYQVPSLHKNLPPGMPGGDPYFFIKTVYWKEIT